MEMADFKKRLQENIPGDFYVDSRCINCGNCRELAPGVFGDSGRYAYVKSQPRNATERREALQALIACPVAAIGSRNSDRRPVMGDFPMPIEDTVSYCGFNSAESYGGSSYFIEHPHGNWLVDSPRFVPHLIKRFETLGGLRYIFLTHKDDVAESEEYARHFKAERIIHEADRIAAPTAEILLRGTSPVELVPGFKIIPVPGHTKGHCVLLYKEKFLFTGDHLEWNPEENSLGAYRDYCWYDWQEQTRSMEKLLPFRFEWVLPGHGHRHRGTVQQMRAEVQRLVEKMKQPAVSYLSERL